MTDAVPQQMIEDAIAQAARWQERANKLLTSEEKAQQEQLKRLLGHPMDKVVLAKLFDQSFRSSNAARVADQIEYLLKTFGTPEFFSTLEKTFVLLFRGIGRHLPGVSIPKMIEKMRESSRRLVIPGEEETLAAYLEKRRQQGVQVNLNHLGEAVLGETEAARRLDRYLQDLANPAVEYLSIKASTIYSQIHPLAFDHGVAVLKARLSRLYRAAVENSFERADGTRVAKFVNLDMEEYRDLAVTVEAFQQTLDQEDFKNYTAGIVLQAYLPDSHAIQRKLTRWARARVDAGGSPIKIRMVKGANMEMEQIETALYNWPLAPFDNKPDTDANYKRMVLYGLRPENARAVRLGVASHNLFELAFAHAAAAQNGTGEAMVFEMLEGMADHVCRALASDGLPLLLYAPVADEKEFISAIAYLIRRMDENTGEHNFLRHIPFLTTTSEAWRRLQEGFEASCGRIGALADHPHRIQDRLDEAFPEETGTLALNEFRNEADTDWSLAANVRWAQQIRIRWKMKAGDEPLRIPVVVAGANLEGERAVQAIMDPNQLPQKICVAEYRLAGADDVHKAVDAARQDPDGWRRLTLDQRHAVLSRVASGLRRARADLIGAAAADTGKIFTEADVEVSEAIDFAEFYPFSARTFDWRGHLECRGRGVGVVASPWNFPIAIPCGGILAALAAGNTVIFKPASDAVLTAWVLCQAFWDAGISKNTLQFVPGSGAEVGRALVGHPDVDFVILTGGTQTGLNMLDQRPDLFLAAETGGKNATIVTAMADRDQAVRNIIYSAFGHGGQKCSATSLLILEKEVYNDRAFRKNLVDAAASLPVGPAWEFENRLGPLIKPPEGPLLRGLTRLERGETWALEPRPSRDNPNLWTPGIKWDVQPGSFTHTTELFGPVLGVMRADDLEEAIELANQTGYGLTSGIESLDPREIAQWKAGIRAGNLYVNRGTTGAITLRQPFGGMGKSAIGPAIKAGSPNYVAQFMAFHEHGAPPMATITGDHPLLALAHRWQRKCQWGGVGPWQADLEKTVRAIKSYLHYAQTEFQAVHDYFNLRGQDNLFRYLPLERVVVCVHADDSLFEVLARIAAARIAGCGTLLNLPPDLDNEVTRFLLGDEGRLILDEADIRHFTPQGISDTLTEVDRLRYAAADRVPPEVYAAAARSGRYIAREPVLMDGRIELMHYTINQSICDNYHRYGNLGERGLVRKQY
ncbi:MAG: bifunctional proline dehydrogenase/L-glutamate gamma-semialdehyde dehydrogenase [Desulfosarcinaceae bacterium]